MNTVTDAIKSKLTMSADQITSKYLANASEYALKHGLPTALAAHYKYCSVVEEDMGGDKFTWKTSVVDCPTCGLTLRRKGAFTMKVKEYPQKRVLVGSCAACGQRFHCGPLGVSTASRDCNLDEMYDDSMISTTTKSTSDTASQFSSNPNRSLNRSLNNKSVSKKRKPASALARLAALEDSVMDNSLSSFLTTFQM